MKCKDCKNLKNRSTYGQCYAHENCKICKDSDDGCIMFESIIQTNGDRIRAGKINTKCDFPNESFKELKAEIARLRKDLQEIAGLRKDLQEIAEFAASEYEKRIPSPSCVEFFTIKRYSEKALKGDKT